jgi:hypothetical protein
VPVPGLRVESDGAYVAIDLPPEPAGGALPWLFGGATFAVLAVVALVRAGPIGLFMLVLAVAPFVGAIALSTLERARGGARVEIRAGELTATSGYVFSKRVSLPLSQVSALFAARWWDRARGFGATLLVVTRSGERIALFPPRASEVLVVSAERVLSPRLAGRR